MDRQGNKEISGIYTKTVDLSHIDTFLFDLDGTLVDSSGDIYVAVVHTLKELGFEPLPKEDVIKHVGYGGRKLLEGVLNTKDEKLLDKAVEIFRDYYFKNPVVYSKTYDGIKDLLKTLKEKNKKIAVVTNKYEDISWEVVNGVGIGEYIDFLVGGDTTSEKKPSPVPVLYALERLGSKEAVIIGDSETDINAGKKAGIETCLVMYGFGKKDLALASNPDYIVESIKQIIV